MIQYVVSTGRSWELLASTQWGTIINQFYLITDKSKEIFMDKLRNSGEENVANTKLLDIATTDPSPEHKDSKYSRVTKALGILAVSALVAGGIVYGLRDRSDDTTDVTTDTTITTNEGEPGNDPIAKSDLDLAKAGYNCGNTAPVENGEISNDYDVQLAYLAENPVLAENIMDFAIDNTKYGMGREAFDFLNENSIKNPNTSGEITDNEDANNYAHMMTTVTLSQPRNYMNTTCNPDQNPKPIENHKITGHVTGAIMLAEDLETWQSLASNADRFDIVDLGIRDNEEHWVMIVTEATGCNNQIRLIRDVPTETPKVTTTVTTVPGVTVTTTPGTTIPKCADGMGAQYGKPCGTLGEGPEQQPVQENPNGVDTEPTSGYVPSSDGGDPAPATTIPSPEVPTTIAPPATIPPEVTVPVTSTIPAPR